MTRTELAAAASVATLLLLLSASVALAASFVDARYDEDMDELVVTIEYRGTNPDHAFSVKWGRCEASKVAGTNRISARVVDSQWNDAARQSFTKTMRLGLRNLRCRPAIVALFTAPQSTINVMIPARGGTDRQLRGPRTDSN